MFDSFRNFIYSHKGQFNDLSQTIWTHPETAWKEKFAVAALAEFLKNNGLDPEVGCFDLETALRCEVETGSGCGPVVAIAAEYDALPEIGHGCGHNLICTAGVAAFLAVTEFMKKHAVPGKVILYGTPAEEGGGGKVKMANAGCLEGVDAAIMVHPDIINKIDCGSTANNGLQVTFYGRAAHAAASPEKGINALDAVTLLFAAVNAYRQQLPGYALIHGVIDNGGVAPNIIPDIAVCRFYLRTAVESFAPELERRFVNMVRGAELMTECTAEIVPFREAYRARKPNAPMNDEFARCMESAGLEVIRPKTSGRGSSDFGNFSQLVPGIHPYFAIVPENTGKVVCHSPEFRDAAGSDFALDNALIAAAAMAQTIWRFMTDDSFRNDVKKDFKREDI